MISVKVAKVRKNALVPQYMTQGSAGCDVTACIDSAIELLPQKRIAVPTGLRFEIPVGYEIQVRPRSGLSFKKGLTVVNAPGTIDSDFRGEVMVLLVNLSEETVIIEPNDRIAQLVLNEVQQIQWQEVAEVSETERGEGGFGSTGVKVQKDSPTMSLT